MPEISAKKYLLSNAKTNLIRVGASTLATLVLTPFIIKNIGIESFSYVSLTSFFISFSSFFDLGLSKSLVFLLNDKSITYEKRCQYVTGQGLVVLILCCFVFLFGILSLITGLEVLGQALPINDSYYYVVTISSFIILIGTIFDQYQCSILESYFLLNYVNNGTTIKIMSLNILYLINLFLWNNVSFYIISAVISSAIVSLYYAFVIKTKISIKFVMPNKHIINTLFTQAFIFFRYSILNNIYVSLPRLAIMYLSPVLSYVGILDVINKLTLSVVNISSSLLRPLYSLTRREPEKIAKNLNRIMFVNIIIGISFIIIVLLFNNEIVNYFFNNSINDYSLINLVLILYSISSSFYLISQPFSFYIMGEGKVNLLSFIYMLNIFLFLSLYIIMTFLIHKDILLTVAISNICVSIMYFLYLLYLVKKIKKTRLTN